MKYDLSRIMRAAWGIFRKYAVSFSEALHRAWQSVKCESVNAERITKAKADAGIIEETHTWSEWRNAGREVVHGSKCLFGCDLIWASRGDGCIFKARFFGLSQTQPIEG